MNLNKVFIIGRLTADPQLRATPSGQQVTTLGVATNRTWTDKAGLKQEAVEFHSVVVWGRQAEIVGKFLNKGSLIYIEGRLQTREWDDKQGQKRRTTEVIAERIQLGPRAGAGGSTGFTAGGARGASTPSSPLAASSSASSGPISAPVPAPELPTIEIEEDIKPEDLPF